MTVEPVYERGCASVAPVRAELLQALAEAGLPSRWREWDAQDPASPPRLRGFGSPTALMNGRELMGIEPKPGTSCCRVYHTSEGRSARTPGATAIVAALRQGTETDARRRAVADGA
jgi:mercuric ion transport protein